MAHPVVFEIFSELRAKSNLLEGDRDVFGFINRAYGTRNINNQSEVCQVLEKYNCQPFTSDGSLNDQISFWRKNKAIFAVLGSDLTNMIFTNDTRIFSITPRYFGDLFFYGLAAGLGLEWNEMTFNEDKIVEFRNPRHKSSFNIDPNDLESFIQFAA